MKELERKRRAWALAHRILSIVRLLPSLEGKELLVVETAEISRAMGTTGPAVLEEVRRFVFDVVALLGGHGVRVVCGCGYLSLLVCDEARHEEILGRREDTSFRPADLDDYFETHVLAARGAGPDDVRQICDDEGRT